MSILSKIEEHAEHILHVMKELLQHQIQNFGGAAQHTQEVVNALEEHLAPVVETPVVASVDNVALTNQTIGDPSPVAITTTSAQ
jgi:hypothetical protein